MSGLGQGFRASDFGFGKELQTPEMVDEDDKKLLFEPVERLIQKSGKCQPFFPFFIRD